ncbi:MAG TPA: hypothetical protein VGS41_07640 [Chthonomonadales bacterium]|nr:hypothetical protein [Chthonomonadales bacterium]
MFCGRRSVVRAARWAVIRLAGAIILAGAVVASQSRARSLANWGSLLHIGPSHIIASRPHVATPSAARARIGAQGIPIVCTANPTSVTGGNVFSCSITVNSVPSGGCYVWVNTTNSSLFTSPSGSWPYKLVFPSGGSATQSFQVLTSTVHSNTSGVVGSCEADISPTNSSNWQVSATEGVTAN